MSTLLPSIYLLILFTTLSIIVFFLVKQILKRKETELEFSLLQEKIRSKNANYFDYYSLGVIYLSKKLFDQAIIQFSKALKNWDKSDSVGLSNLYNTIGFTYSESGQFDVAIYYYKEAITLKPDYIIALNNLAYVYEKKKLLQEAIDVYKKVLDYDTLNEIANEKLESLKIRFKNRDDRI